VHRHTFFNIVEDAVTSWMLAQIGDLIESRGRKPTFVEVGANDGVIDNKLYKFISSRGWAGLSIEPVPIAFENLKKNYKDFPNVIPLNMAVADRPGKLPFYAVVNTEHFQHSMMSSFDRDSPSSRSVY
jgi:FkbM family methyltransferase